MGGRGCARGRRGARRGLVAVGRVGDRSRSSGRCCSGLLAICARRGRQAVFHSVVALVALAVHPAVHARLQGQIHLLCQVTFAHAGHASVVTWQLSTECMGESLR